MLWGREAESTAIRRGVILWMNEPPGLSRRGPRPSESGTSPPPQRQPRHFRFAEVADRGGAGEAAADEEERGGFPEQAAVVAAAVAAGDEDGADAGHADLPAVVVA